MLEKWNFIDPVANSTTPQMNRQKSARNLIAISIDRRNCTGLFFDSKKDVQNAASLSKCDCNDFNFAGTAPRKRFAPCMHIYRLAMELGLLEAKYEDHRARKAQLAHQIVQKKQAETARLQSLLREHGAWGGWNNAVHKSGLQRNRQYRAYFILDDGDAVQEFKEGWIIHNYRVTLYSCECHDFIDRKLPCKHVYASALASGIALPLTHEAFIAAKDQGLENVFRYEDS